MELLIALVTLTLFEIVLGIDNIVFIAILTGKLPLEQQPKARKLGLTLALVMRIILLGLLSVILALDDPIFHLSSILPADWLTEEIDEISIKDIILFVGGLFLIWKSVHEIHKKLEGQDEERSAADNPSFSSVLFQIAMMDMIFSLDSVITAVGMVKSGADNPYGIWVMIAAVVLAMGVMLAFAEQVSAFVAKNPTIKMLALSFLILIGVMLVAEGVGTHFDKKIIYFAMAFALGVEMLNLRVRHISQQRRAQKTDSEH